MERCRSEHPNNRESKHVNTALSTAIPANTAPAAAPASGTAPAT
jgi:hypothetical protein